jgi:hypothetical protein
VTSRIDQVLADFRARVMDRDATTQRMLTERWLAVEARLDAQATALALEIDTLRNAGQTITPGKLARLDRYQALLAQAQVEVEQYERWANGQIAENQRVYAEMGRGYFEAAMQAALTNPEGIAVNFNRLPVGATNAMIGFAGNGAPLLDLLIKDYPKTAAGLTQALVNGTAQGWNPRKTAREMMRAMGGNLDRALVIARTEQLRSYRAAAQVGLESNADILDGWVWSSALTANTCPVCWALHGSIHPVTEVLQDHVCGRCTARPLTKPWKEIGKVIGVDLSGIEETRTAVITGDQALSRRGEDFQRELLGPGRYELWKSGVKLADMVMWKDDPEWGKSPALRPLKEFADAVR